MIQNFEVKCDKRVKFQGFGDDLLPSWIFFLILTLCALCIYATQAQRIKKVQQTKTVWCECVFVSNGARFRVTETRIARTAGLRLCFRGTTILVASTMCKVSRISDTIALIAVRISLSHHDLLGDKRVLDTQRKERSWLWCELLY